MNLDAEGIAALSDQSSERFKAMSLLISSTIKSVLDNKNIGDVVMIRFTAGLGATIQVVFRIIYFRF